MFPTLGSLYSGSIYRSLAKKSIFYRVVSTVYYLVLYKWKVFRREAPNDRKWLNQFTVNFFDIKYDVQPYSDKDLNTLTNRGQHTDDLLKFIDQLDVFVGSSISIENEIVKGFPFVGGNK